MILYKPATRPLPGLSLTHISLGWRDGLSEFVALDEGHEDGPAFPQCLPAGLAVGRAGEKPTQLGDPTQKGSVAPEAFGRSLKLGREDLEGRSWGVRRGGAVAPGGIPQRQKADGDDRQRPEQRHQPIRLREPALLGPAPRFPRFVKLLHDPPPGVPRDNLERLIEALNRTRRQQQPREPVVPDPHTPDPDRRAPPAKAPWGRCGAAEAQARARPHKPPPRQPCSRCSRPPPG